MTEKFDCIFVSSGSLNDRDGEDEIEITSENGIYTFDNKKKNPNKEYPFLVRVGGGFQAFRTRREAKRFYNQD